ncbi:MAG: ComEC/Rec2 family competence protein [Pirellulaceae bacterium]|nr:ComEC/Rec2 family competence protein [Pirellulaceae bacterium]
MVTADTERNSMGAAGWRHQPLLWTCLATGLGVVLDRQTGPGLPVWIAAGAVGAGWYVCLWWLGWRRASAVGLLLAAGSVAAAWHHVDWRLFGDDDLGRAARPDARPVVLEAIILESPRRAPVAEIPGAGGAEERWRTAVRVKQVRDGAVWRPASGLARLTGSGAPPKLAAGDRVRVFGQLQAVSPADNPGAVDYALLARGQRRLCLIRASHVGAVELRARSTAWSASRYLHWLRGHCHALLRRHVGPARCELAATLLLGIRDELPGERTESFLMTGTMHVLAISGLHVGLLIGGLWWVARWLTLPRVMTLLLVVGFALFYAALSGLRPPVMRAALLVAAWCEARLLQRPAAALNTLAGSALVLIVMRPSVVFETGAQLSFLAVATLVGWRFGSWRTVAADPLRQLVDQARPWPVRWLRRSLATWVRLWWRGVVVWLVSLPLVLARFHVLSLSGVLLNAVLWPPLVVSLFAGLLTMLVGGLVPGLGWLCGRVCDGGLWCLETMVDLAGRVPGGHHWLPGPPTWFLLLFYTVWATCVLLPRRDAESAAGAPGWPVAFSAWRTALLLVLAAASVVVSPALRSWEYRRADRPLRVTFLAMGHGTSVLCEFSDGRTLLYDAGSLGDPAGAARTIAQALWARGLLRVDQLVISHADADHYNAVPELLGRFAVGQVWVAPTLLRRTDEGTWALRRGIGATGVPVRCLVAGDRRQMAERTWLAVLHPPPDGVAGSDNANSLVLRITHQGRSVLLTGDIEGNGLEAMLNLPPLACDVLLAPHHGSRHSRPDDVLRWARPRFLVISGGRTDSLEQMRRITGWERGRVLHTAQGGAVIAELDRESVRVRAWRDPRR